MAILGLCTSCEGEGGGKTAVKDTDLIIEIVSWGSEKLITRGAEEDTLGFFLMRHSWIIWNL